MNKIATILIAVVSWLGLSAQDPHLSLFNGLPMGINPAYTGNFNGNFRVGAQFRDQWNSVLANENIASYRTNIATLEARTNRGVDENDFVGMGVYFMNDVAGQSRLSNTKLGLSGAYRKALDQYGDHFISVGGQLAFHQSRINLKDLTWGNQWNVDRYDPSIIGESNNLDDNIIFYDLSAGLTWGYNKFGTRNRFYAGIGVLHLNEPNFSFFRANSTGPNIDASAKLPMRINFNAGAGLQVNNRMDVVPKLLVMSQGKSFETVFGGDVRLLLDPSDENSNSVYFGVLSRVVGGDPNNVLNSSSLNFESFIPSARIDYNNFEVGVGYDINVSDLRRASKFQGGFELYINYAFRIKNSKMRKLFCPKI
jgi:type IX secretion system PorP/SprF family membrane protein